MCLRRCAKRWGDDDNELPMALRHSLGEQLQRLRQLSVDMAGIEQRLEEFAAGTDATRTFLGTTTAPGPSDQARRCLPAHAVDPWCKSSSIRQRRGQALDPLQSWALSVQVRQGHNKAACALANPQELPETILTMAKGSVPKQTMPITIPAFEAA